MQRNGEEGWIYTRAWDRSVENAMVNPAVKRIIQRSYTGSHKGASGYRLCLSGNCSWSGIQSPVGCALLSLFFRSFFLSFGCQESIILG
jgi:hypothetical protein